MRHTALVGVDVKDYTLDDYQAFGFFGGTPLNIFNPNYSGQGVYAGAPYQDSFRKLRQVGVYLQDQIKFDRFTLLLTGRHDTIGKAMTTGSAPVRLTGRTRSSRAVPA